MAVPAEPATRTWPRKITALRDRLLRVLGKSFNIVNVLIRKQQMWGGSGKGTGTYFIQQRQCVAYLKRG